MSNIEVQSSVPIKVTLLGTGTSGPRIERFGPSTLVEAGPEKLLFDCGRGASQRLWQLRIPLGDVTALFLTHLHSDHTIGVPDLWLTGWLPPSYGRRSVPLRFYGPAGTGQMMCYLEKAFEANILFRLEDEKLPRQGVEVHAEDIGEGLVYNRNGVRVSAFEVDHGQVIKPAFGYRIEHAGRVVVISGDTRFCENLINFSSGTDVLIHEVAAAREELLNRSAAMRRIIAHHTSPVEAGEVFARVNPRLAVYSHIVLLSDPTVAEITIQELIALTRKTYGGPLEVGEDLMTIEVNEDQRVSCVARGKLS
jgi:ribonuclease Z